MKASTAFSLLALSALTSSTPIDPRQASSTFFMISIHSGNENVHLQPVNANDGLFWIGKPTTLSCPSVVESCPVNPYNQTVLDYFPVTTALAPSVEVPGGQVVYIQGPTGPTPGALSFNEAHVAAPEYAISSGFTFDGSNLVFATTQFYACPAMGAYFVTAVDPAAAISPLCIGIAIDTFAYTSAVPAAWQYD